MAQKTKDVDPSTVTKPVDLAKEAGVPPQMIYSYIRAGRIKAFEGNLEGSERTQKLIPSDVATEWLEGYQERKAAREQEAEEATTS